MIGSLVSSRREIYLFYFGKIESNWRIGFGRQLKFNHFIFNVVRIEFLELGVSCRICREVYLLRAKLLLVSMLAKISALNTFENSIGRKSQQ